MAPPLLIIHYIDNKPDGDRKEMVLEKYNSLIDSYKLNSSGIQNSGSKPKSTYNQV